MSDNKIEIGRNSRQYSEWRGTIIKRDNYQCKKCGAKEKLHAHHIKSWKEYPDLRFEIDNGKTLCSSCHLKEHIVPTPDPWAEQIKHLKMRFNTDAGFKSMVDLCFQLYEKQGFNEIDFIAALNYFTYLKEKK